MNAIKGIFVDFELLSLRSSGLKEEIEALRRCAAHYTACAEELRALWKGEASDVLYAKLQENIVSLNELIGILQRANDGFNSALKLYSDSDQRAMEAVLAADRI